MRHLATTIATSRSLRVASPTHASLRYKTVAGDAAGFSTRDSSEQDKNPALDSELLGGHDSETLKILLPRRSPTCSRREFCRRAEPTSSRKHGLPMLQKEKGHLRKQTFWFSGDGEAMDGQTPCVEMISNNQELTDVERAIEIVINNFHCYAVKGRKECLTPNELRDLVGQRLPQLGKGINTLEEKIECLGDADEAKLQFGEYWDIMGDAAKGCRASGAKK
ncbi:hypothetical protein lerEdw1_002921 [Lerista edwardsae]|nr:hypothetical protein lerEdw1_002921 [Lerista edwardsae]